MPLSDCSACLVDSKYTGTLACIERRSLLVPNPSLIFWFSSYYRLNLGNHHTWLITKTFQVNISQVRFLLFFLLFPAGCRFSKIGSCISNDRLQIFRHFVARRRFGKILKGVLLNKLRRKSWTVWKINLLCRKIRSKQKITMLEATSKLQKCGQYFRYSTIV